MHKMLERLLILLRLKKKSVIAVMGFISIVQIALGTMLKWTKLLNTTRNTLLEKSWTNSCLQNARSAKDWDKFANLQDLMRIGK